MRYWVRFLIFDEKPIRNGEPLGTGLVAFCVSKKPLTPSLMVPVPDGSLVGFQESCQRMISMINLRLETNS